MKIIPVLDILNGWVVRGVQGQRDQYRPVQSVLVPDAHPLTVAHAFAQHGFTDAYLADLDAIQGGPLNLVLYQQIIRKSHLSLMIDAGVSQDSQLSKLLASNVSFTIIGTETLQNLDFLESAIACSGFDRLIISVDMKHGKLLAQNSDIRQMQPMQLIDKLIQLGFSRLIILELTTIGSEHGVQYDIVRKILREYSVEVYTGGGIRNLQDLFLAQQEGVMGVLLATALHKGTITPIELREAGFL